MFRLLRYFSITSLLSMLLAVIALGALHQLFENNYLLEFGEGRNVALAQSLENTAGPLLRSIADAADTLDAEALRHHPAIDSLNQIVRDAVRNTATVQVKIYHLDGRTLFSADTAQSGENMGDNSGFISARQGETSSALAHYDKFMSFDGEIANRDVLSSFVPLRPDAGAPVESVLEVFTDITDLLASDKKQQRQVSLSVLGVLVALYGILFLIVKHADTILKKQRELQQQTEQRLSHATTHDALTNLPNRELLLDRIKQSLTAAQRHNKMLAVAVVDLDNFQNINNSLGHTTGDKVLQIVAQRLTQCLRDDDTIARSGGDEFLLSLPDIRSNVDLFQVAKKLIAAVALPIELEGRELHLTASIGIALYPEHGIDAETLLRKADLAMYAAKRLGRNRHQLFVEHMNDEVQKQVQLEDGMWRALENNEFVLYYQPIIDLKTGAIVGAEALLRWPNAHGDWFTPEEFIPMSEKCGLIVPLSEWVLSEACTQLQAWRESEPGLAEFTMAVNLSPRHFATAGLATMVSDMIAQTELDPRWLHLDISEGLLMGMNESVLTNFEGLKRLGIKFALDDFGSGYSSLGYLRNFPVDLLKIDRSFIGGLTDNDDNAAIVTAIITLANNLGLTVVAKGVETDAQLALLQQLGCQQAQGFLFSRPLPADDFLSLVAELRDMRITQSLIQFPT